MLKNGYTYQDTKSQSIITTKSQSTNCKFPILFIDYEFKYSPANTSVRVAKALPNCNYQPIITEFWNLENDTSGPNMVRGIWQINNYIETYIKLQSNFIVVSFSTNINSR